MSHIPNSAMPHAGRMEPTEEEGRGGSLFGGAGRLAEKARENPGKTAAGAAVIAGLAAAAAVPFLASRDRKKSASPRKPAAKKSASARKSSSGSRSKKAH